ncbi:hypothetical protein [Streptomyces daliensis]
MQHHRRDEALTDDASVACRDAAPARLQKRRDLDVSCTLPAMPSGLEKTGVAILGDAREHRVELSAVNIMAMNYGITAPRTPATWAAMRSGRPKPHTTSSPTRSASARRRPGRPSP